MKTPKINRYRDRSLYYCRVCYRGHTTKDGRNVKVPGRGCLGCALALEELVYSVEFTNVSEPPPDLRIKYHTDEERHRARIEQQMRWNARNPDKVNEYRRKYEAKPERRERARQAWHNRTPEEKQMIQQRQQERRLLKKQEQDNEHKGT